MSRSAAAAVNHQTHPCLPTGMTLSHVIELIERVGRHIGLGARRREALLRMIRQTAPTDWTASDRDPVCFRPQQDLAQDLGITDRAMRAHEQALAQLGLAIIDTTANGRRSGRMLPGGRRLGVNFRPLIDRIGWLMDLDEAHQAAMRRIVALRLECSAAKRDARQMVEQLLEIDPRHRKLPAYLQRMASWPRRYSPFRCAEELDAHLDEINELVDDVRAELQCRDDSSGRAESQIPAILNTTPKILEFCSGSSAMKGTARKRADNDFLKSAPSGAECREKSIGGLSPAGNPDDLSWLTPEKIRSIAGQNFRFCLDAICPVGEQMTDRHLRSVAIMLLPDLGINASAWEEALQVFGSMRAALAVLIIDANRNHPTHPIHSPGGALRAFTRLQLAGQFNLSGSLIGLVERSRAEP